MFDIITKEEYWHWLEQGEQPARRFRARLTRLLGRRRLYELKDVQDAFVLSRLKGARGATILEIGAGNSRILPVLSLANECWCADRFQGKGRGPTRPPRMPRVKAVNAYMGEFSPALASGSFDFVFSVSVVEHVPLQALEAFFGDCARLLKPGGRMIHAIDNYLFDEQDSALAQDFRQRIQAYLSFADRPDLGIKLSEEPGIDQDVPFSCRYATVPDNVLHEWNTHRPSAKRAAGQVVSIKSEWLKYSPTG